MLTSLDIVLWEPLKAVKQESDDETYVIFKLSVNTCSSHRKYFLETQNLTYENVKQLWNTCMHIHVHGNNQPLHA